MFDRIFADYLVLNGKISTPDMEAVFEAQETSRARLGVIAVMEKLMTVEQAEEVNHLQSVYDKRFGDIAVEKHYLNAGQVERLLCLQGNQFLSFLQTIVDLKFMTMEEINNNLTAFQTDHSFTQMNMEDLKSCSVARIIPLYLFQQPSFTQDFCGLFMRTIIRLLDYRVYICKPYIVDQVQAKCLSMQQLIGDHSVLCSLHSEPEQMISVAKLFAGDKYINTSEDALDALCELINCVNGMFATDLATENIDLDMDIPHYYSEELTLASESILCLPIKFPNCEITVSITIDHEFEIQ
ncbi:MAG: chemotaxis protein CheX [Eubacteriales bacterium]